MTTWCQRARPPESSVQLLDGAICSDTPTPGSIRLLLTDLRDRQEELLRQMLDQQQLFYKQLSDVHDMVRASIDAQLVSKRCQEELLAKFNRHSLKSGVHEMTGVLEIIGDSIQIPRAGVAEHGDNSSAHAEKDPRLANGSGAAETGGEYTLSPMADHGGNASADAEQDNSRLSMDSAVTKMAGGYTGGAYAQAPRARTDHDECKSPDAAKDFCTHESLPSADLTNSASNPNLNRGNTLTLAPGKSKKRVSIVSLMSNEFTFPVQVRMYKFLKSKEFELAIAVLIVANALVMCVESQYHGLDVGFHLQFPGRPVEAHAVWSGADDVFLVFDWIFGCLFFFEVLVKLFVWGRAYFYFQKGPPPQDLQLQGWTLSCWQCWSNVQGWNLLDLSCVIAFCFDKMAPVGAIDPRTIRLLRLFRLFRMVRLVRFLETMDHLYIMTTAIAGVRDVLFWAIMLLLIMLLTCDLFLVQILHATYFDSVKAADLTEQQLMRHHQMYEYFGTCTRCLLSMFELTLGNWPPVVRLLSEEASEWFTLICLLHKLTIGFAVISVISGVILQETFKVAQTDDMIMYRQKKKAGEVVRRKLTALFNELDTSGDGMLEMSEVEELSRLPDVKIWLGSLGIETDDVETLFNLIDLNGDGYITFDEMLSEMPRLQGTARSIDLLTLRNVVRGLQKDKPAPKTKAAQLAHPEPPTLPPSLT